MYAVRERDDDDLRSHARIGLSDRAHGGGGVDGLVTVAVAIVVAIMVAIIIVVVGGKRHSREGEKGERKLHLFDAEILSIGATRIKCPTIDSNKCVYVVERD